MIRISPRQLITIIALGAVALLAILLARFEIVGANGCATIVFVAALLAVLGAPAEGASTESFDALRAAVRRVLDGKKPEAPAGSPLAVARVYDELKEAHEALQAATARSNKSESELEDAANSLASGVRRLR